VRRHVGLVGQRYTSAFGCRVGPEHQRPQACVAAPTLAAWWTPRVSHPASVLLLCALGPIGRILPFPVAWAVETAARNSWESDPKIPRPGDKTLEGVFAAATYRVGVV
jgi:hypothetical protein